ncbi:M28 family peptidase [Winogradskyella pulchriflava]|uniref:M28 family peptidase n=1 Tax=Winogradskyella pulchriflava TaxID=1110688 RepID=A0ABV6Q499_9FLAO
MIKKFVHIIATVIVVTNFSFSQSIEDLINQVSSANLQTNVSILSGEQSATINGSNQTIASRFHSNNDLAADFIREQFEGLPNLTVEVQNFNTTGKNIIATQLGQTSPDDVYIVCAHYDSVNIYCADDNATGVAAVIEMARILSGQCTDNTIVYALWDEEEIGLRGANYYAQQAADDTNGNTRDNILAVVNMDMIGYDGDAPGTAGDNDFDIDVRNVANSLAIVSDLQQILTDYTFNLNPIIVNPGTDASDHARFWNEGYSAVLVGESWETNDRTPDYHTADDRVDDLDFQYMTEITKLVLTYMATKADLVDLDNSVTQSSTSLTANQASASYQWYNCDTNTIIPGATNQTFVPTVNGNYRVSISNGSCEEISACYNFTTLSAEEFTKEDIQIYPNPVNNILNISNNTNTKLHISVVDITGKEIKKLKSKKESIQINLKNNASGVYFIKLTSKAKSSTYRFVKD